jgi:DNA-binding NtrC family response regulator
VLTPLESDSYTLEHRPYSVMRIPRLLVVASDQALRHSLLSLAGSIPYQLVESPPSTLSRFFEGAHPALVVIGPAVSQHAEALRVSRVVRQWAPLLPIIIVTGHGSEEFAVESMRAGINDYFRVPIDTDALRAAVLRLMLAGAAAPPMPVGRMDTVMVGTSAEAERIRVAIASIASSDCNVLITGETGTGKELAAELVHTQSRRARQPFVSINCAAIPESLLESELFGYERGAFTGATASSAGRLSAAHRGTALLDEVGDLSPASQAKVLRLVEDKELSRLGSTRTARIDARIVAATNQPLEARVAEGRFRSDLYFRLNVARVHLAPLRERQEDIPQLVMHYLRALRATVGGVVESMTAEAMAVLTAYRWPGNIRELKNTVERMLMCGRSRQIDAEELPEEFQAAGEARRRSFERERSVLFAALASANGNKSEAARALQCSRMTLYRRLAKCGLRETRHETSRRAGNRL